MSTEIKKLKIKNENEKLKTKFKGQGPPPDPGSVVKSLLIIFHKITFFFLVSKFVISNIIV